MRSLADLVNDETVMSEFRRARYDVFVGEMFDPCMFYGACNERRRAL